MSNTLRLCIFTLVLAISSGSLWPFSLSFTQAMAACLLEGQTDEGPPISQGDVITVSEALTDEGPGGGPEDEDEEPPSGNTPISGQTVICEGDIDNTGVFSTNPPDGDGTNGDNITVTIKGPDGGIEVSDDRPGIFLDNGATITIEGPNRPVSTTADGTPAIRVLNDAKITVLGVVSTAGAEATGIQAGSTAKIVINEGEVSTTGETSNAITTGSAADIDLSGESKISTTGTGANAVTTGTGSAIDLVGTSQISTTGANAHTIVFNGATNSTLSIGTGTSVTTEGSNANAVQINRAENETNSTGGTVNVSGTVGTAGEQSTAIVGSAENLNVTVASGGVVSTQGSGANGIEIRSSGATITVSAGGEVKIEGNSAAAVSAGRSANVEVSGTVSTAGENSQGVEIDDGSTLNVTDGGKITASASSAQAVVIEDTADSATVNVAAGGQINSSGQAIASSGTTTTTTQIDGNVTGGGSAPTVALSSGEDTVTVNGTVTNTGSSSAISTGTGNDTVTVNGSVTSTSSNSPVIDLGTGDDTLNDNSSQTISGSGTLVSAGDGSDTLNLHNGKINDSANYDSFETIDVAANSNPGDPANGNGTTLNVTNNLSGSTLNVRDDSQVNVQDGGTIDLRADDSANGGSGQQGGNISFESGSAANVQTENRTGSQPTQVFSNTTFAEGTTVNTSSNFIRGVTNNSATGNGEITLQSDFTNRLRTENAQRFGAALNAIVDSGVLSAEQQNTLDQLISDAPTADEAEAVISQFSGEVKAQGAAGAVQAATLFNNSLTPSGTRVDSRRSPISIVSETADNPLNDTSAIGNGAWISGLAGLISADDNDQSTEFDANTYGVAVGYDRAISSGENGKAVFGVGVGYSGTGVDGVRDSADVTSYSVGTYFDGNSGPLHANVAASYSSQTIESSGSEDSSGGIFVATAEGFYNLRQKSELAIGPIGRLSGAFGSYSGFDTDSDTFSTSYDSADVSQLMAGLGVRFGGQSQVDLGLLSLNLDLLYETALSDDSVEFEGQLAGNNVGIAAPFTNSSGFYVGAEAALAISERSSVGFRYQGNLGDNTQSHTGEIKFSILF